MISSTPDIYKLPEDFNITAFNDKLLRTFKTIANYTNQGELEHWRYEFMINILKSFASSDAFIGLKSEIRIDMIQCWEDIRYILEQLIDLFTDEVTENNAAIEYYLRKKLLPESLKEAANHIN